MILTMIDKHEIVTNYSNKFDNISINEKGLERTMISQNHSQLNLIPDNTASFSSVGLNMFKNIAVGNRVDTKFLLNYDHLISTLGFLKSFYWILEINSSRIHHYKTLYYDTEQFDLYHRHHSGTRSTYKVRSREYTNSNKYFLEVKKKRIGTRRSIKKRMEIPQMTMALSSNSREEYFVKNNTPISPKSLKPTLWVEFDRIALLNKKTRERITLDTNLTYRDKKGTKDLPNIVIAELKQEVIDRHSPFFSYMRFMRLRPFGFSKYSVGTSMLNPHLKKNRVKPKLLMIDKTLKER